MKAKTAMTAASAKLDLLKLHKADYVAPKKPVRIDLKPAQYLSIEGRGKPGGQDFQDCIGALISMAYTIKMTRKFAGLGDYTVAKLEAIYPDIASADSGKTEDWRWKLLILSPDFLGQADLADAVARLAKRGKAGCAERVRLEQIGEGPCLQMLHVGPYDRECETVEVMRTAAAAMGQDLAADHHEIYVSDPRRVAPEDLKTILRRRLCPKA